MKLGTEEFESSCAPCRGEPESGTQLESSGPDNSAQDSSDHGQLMSELCTRARPKQSHAPSRPSKNAGGPGQAVTFGDVFRWVVYLPGRVAAVDWHGAPLRPT